MSSLFRSEPMTRAQIILQSEAAYNCVSELGELGVVQFVDLNPGASAFQRKFVSEVKRCEEMERKLRYIERECIRDDIPILEMDEDPLAPPPREMTELEGSLANIERDLVDVNTNYVALRKNHLELIELKHLLKKTEAFLSETHMQITDSNDSGDVQQQQDETHLIEAREEISSMKFNIIAGVIAQSRIISFERMLWRISKGNVFAKFSEIEEEMEDPATGSKLYKSIFMVFFQGEALKTRVKKICEGFHATLYPCPDKASDRREMLFGVNTRLEDLSTVLKQTEEHRHRLLSSGSKNLRVWYTKVRKIKAIYHCLNFFSFDVTQKALVAECWMPQLDIPLIQDSLNRGADASGSTIPPILNVVSTLETPPTFNRVNKYTAGFQNLVDAYGVNSYREVNPAVYTIATFPFLFAVMFGDCGHGTIMLLFGLWMIIQENKLQKAAEGSEIFGIFFGGRYIVMLMGLFSIYTGLMYNDCFSLSLNIFGSHWHVGMNLSYPINLEETFTLDPGNKSQYEGDPYYLGMDPAWQAASNKISFLNTYKMKISLIFGLFHMVFGVCLSLWNKILKRQYVHILVEFIPQLVFLVFIFVYLVFLIFYKWVAYAANTEIHDNPWGEHCAPNLLITFINMMLFKNETSDPKLAFCEGKDIYMYHGQQGIQHALVIIGVLMVPIMLLGGPLHTMYNRHRRRRNYTEMQDELLDNEGGEGSGHGHGGEEAMSEIFIFQAIHTIEYVLGAVSHTASYLRLWALSLAHSQLSEVLWQMVFHMALNQKGYVGSIWIYVIFSFWAVLTLAILVLMEGLSAFLHTLRLHWVEFQSKFYEGQGVIFVPFDFRAALKESEASDKEVLKSTA